MVEEVSRRQKRQRAKRVGILTDAQVAMGWFVILALTALLGAIYLGQASRIASTGRKVQLLQNQLNELKRENAALERDIAEAQSLERLQEEAARLGFVRAAPGDIEYMVVTDYPAVTTPAPVVATPSPSAPVETMSQAIWFALRDSFNNMVRGHSTEADGTRGRSGGN